MAARLLQPLTDNRYSFDDSMSAAEKPSHHNSNLFFLPLVGLGRV